MHTQYHIHTYIQRALDCRPCLGGLNQVYGPNRYYPYSHKQPEQVITETILNHLIIKERDTTTKYIEGLGFKGNAQAGNLFRNMSKLKTKISN